MVLSEVSLVSAEPQSWDRRSVDRLEKPGVDLVLINRTLPWPVADLEPAVMQGAVGTVRCAVGPHDLDHAVQQALDELDLPGQPGLAMDMVSIAMSFMAQYRRSSVKLRIDLADRQGCPKLHCDCVEVRLVTTYVGPTTEYCHSSAGHIRRFAIGSLGFLKGCRHATHRGENLLHRSPSMSAGQRRLCLVLDI